MSLEQEPWQLTAIELGVQIGPLLGRLVDVLESMWTQSRPPRPVPPQFKTPKYAGHSDVEYFIQQFPEVAGANE